MNLDHVLSTKQFLDRSFLNELFELADIMKSNPDAHVLEGRILATVFYEPSTRTRFSFEAAMYKLGGHVITTESAAHFSSVTKGETLEDTIRTIGGYADVIVLRHSEEGAAASAAKVSSVPIINGGDGPGEHPTQALLDLYTIRKERSYVTGIEVALVGDLRNGRTVHSLLYLLALQDDITIRFVAPVQLHIPEEYKKYLTEKEIQWSEHESLDEILETADVFYITRVQKERFDDVQVYQQLRDLFVIDNNSLKIMKFDAVLMHPLPRVTEIAQEVDGDPRAAYFRQAQNGLYIRMALLQMLLES